MPDRRTVYFVSDRTGITAEMLGNSLLVQFDEFHYGRDLFFGAMIRFNDHDLAALLAVGGSALSGASR